jgi:murein DD-endopeptidase MepM/ murein hydrolase activator NlpD
LDALAKGGAALCASGMLQLVDFQFAPKQLFGMEKPTLSAQRTLAPDAAFYLPQQLFAFNGRPEQLRVSAEFSGDKAPAPASGALTIRHGSAPGKYRFPLEGRWLVGAGATPHNHHRWAVPEEFALDIVQIGAGGLSYRGYGSKMRDYYAYGADVLAAADGEVVAVLNNVPDNTKMLRRAKESLHDYQQRLRASQDAMLADARESIPGNHVILRHDVEGGPVYSVYAHLQPESNQLKVGDQLKAGARLGALGGSGNSTEPHLHFHLCDAPDALKCAGMPVSFDNIEIPLSDWDRAIQSGDTVITLPRNTP